MIIIINYLKTSMKYIIIILLLFIGCSHPGDNKPELSNDIFKIEYNNQLHSRIISNLPDAKPLMNDFSPSEQLRLANITIQDFTLADVNTLRRRKFHWNNTHRKLFRWENSD